jgi:hypothetical protein
MIFGQYDPIATLKSLGYAIRTVEQARPSSAPAPALRLSSASATPQAETPALFSAGYAEHVYDRRRADIRKARVGEAA